MRLRKSAQFERVSVELAIAVVVLFFLEVVKNEDDQRLYQSPILFTESH